MKKLIAGNWKMNCTNAEAKNLASGLIADNENADVLVCPPFTAIQDVKNSISNGIFVGGQDCHAEINGAYTGNISAEMLKDIGCEFVILGHSERRSLHGEKDQTVKAKAKTAIDSGLTPIICVGEKLEGRESGEHIKIVLCQVEHSMPESANADNFVIAYEPVWAIGTGKTASTSDIAEMHSAIREFLVGHFGDAGQNLRILYGGSAKPDNAADILSIDNVGGLLVGGASLKAEDFNKIIKSA